MSPFISVRVSLAIVIYINLELYQVYINLELYQIDVKKKNFNGKLKKQLYATP